MADEGNESRIGRMDLNLYLGFRRSPRPRSSDLGSDLALSSLPLSTSSTTEESCGPVEMTSALEPTDSHAPFSPSHASFIPEPSIPPVAPGDGDSNQEYTPYFPSYEPYAPSPVMLLETVEPDISDSPPSPAHPLPPLQETIEPQLSPPGHSERCVPYPDSYTPSYLPRSPSYIPIDPQEASDDLLSVSPLPTVSPLIRSYVPPFLQGVSMYAPPMPSDVPRSPSYSPPSSTYSPQRAEPLGRDDESSSRQDLFESPEYHLRRLIESSHPARLRRFQSSLPYHHYHGGSERSNFGWSASPVPEQLQSMHEMMSFQRPSETTGKHKVPAEGIEADSSEEKEENSQNAANFECNVCLEMAEEPVVTSCGHLFCWPCLYQWLHVHSEHKECPVCKGEVTEANITPIYGRGSSEASDAKKHVESGESNIKIPPRPRGNRFESLRQQLRPISRRFGEGITTSWRRLVNQQMRNRNRFEGHGDLSVPRAGMLNVNGHHVLTRLRARRLLLEELNTDFGPEDEDNNLPGDSTEIPQGSIANPFLRDGVDLWHRPTDSATIPSGSSEGTDHWGRPRDFMNFPRSSSDIHQLFRNGIDPWHQPRVSTTVPRSNDADLAFLDRAELWHRFNMYGLYATADIGRVVGNGNRYGASTSYANPPSPEQPISRANVASASAFVADQVSASSTIAVIQGDVGLPEGSAELNIAGSSRPYRRRMRSSASGSLDMDGSMDAHKRTRLN